MNFKSYMSKLKLLKNNNAFRVILISFLISITACTILQFFQMSQNIYATTDWIIRNFQIFFLSSLFIFFLHLFLVSVTGSLYISSSAVLIILGAIGYSNSKKISVLGEPLYPIDFYQVRNIRSLFEMVGGSISLPIILFILLLGSLLTICFIKLPKLKITFKMRLSALALSVFMIYSYLHFSGSFINVFTVKAGVDVVLWNQPENYESNGFVFGLLSNLQNEIMEKPEGYSEETIIQLAEKYKLQAEELNKQRNSLNSTLKPNIIFMMNETFWDPTRLDSLDFNEDPMAIIRNLMADSSSGWLLSPAFGGNTANVEFEALTGLSMYNLIPGSIPYQQSLNQSSLFPSIVSILEDKGYDTVAIHPYKKVFYRRDRAYTTLGFNSFLGEVDMIHTDRLSDNSYISDQSVVDEILDNLKASSSPMFIHAVTMQNHLPIQPGRNGINSISVSGLTDNAKEELETYSEGIKQSAVAVKNLMDSLSKLEEPTVVVFFGDHLPSFSSSIYEAAGFHTSDASENERLRSETPLFICSNFTIDKRPLGSISPTFLGVTVLDILDQPLNPYYALLESLKSKLPAIKHDLIIDSSNNIKSILSEDEENLLRDYKMIQYDLLKGKQYSLPLLFNTP